IGGSTNSILHLLALAREIGVKLDMRDFERIRKKTPHLANMRPGGLYVMVDLDKAGGIPVVLKSLLSKGLIHGEVMTVTGDNIRKNLESTKIPEDYASWIKRDVLKPIENPIHPMGTLAILKGSLAPNGAVIKTAGLDNPKFVGRARVFET